MRGRWFWVLCCVAPALAYLAIVTRGSFNPFDADYGWQAYNQLALALAAGHQAIPAEAISAEGLYVGGKVYMYYGLVPALLRLLLMPFVDLRLVPVSMLLTWAMLITGQAALQLAVLRIYRANGRDAAINRSLLVAASILIWFSSGSYLLIQNASLYHQPYAAAAMLSSLFVAMLANDLLVRGQRPAGARLLLYALLAGLCVHTRQTYAVGLYAAMLALLLPGRNGWRVAFGQAVLPLLLLFAAGLSYLALGYDRFGRLTIGWSVRDWGFAAIQPLNDRMMTLIDQQFSMVRIIPNLVSIIFGTQGLRIRWIAAWGGGTVENHNLVPVRYLLYTPLGLVLAGVGVWVLMRLWRSQRSAAVALVLPGLGFLATALLQLSYGTMDYRYSAELWPLLLWLILIALRHAEPAKLPSHLRRPAMVAMAVMTLASIVHVATLPRWNWYEAPTIPGSLVLPLPAALAARATAPGARDPTIEPIRQRVGDGRYVR